MAMSEELLASIDDRLMQLVEEMKTLRKFFQVREEFRMTAPEGSEPPDILMPDPEPAKVFLAKTEDAAQKLNAMAAELAQHEPKIARRLGLSPAKKSALAEGIQTAIREGRLYR